MPGRALALVVAVVTLVAAGNRGRCTAQVSVQSGPLTAVLAPHAPRPQSLRVGTSAAATSFDPVVVTLPGDRWFEHLPNTGLANYSHGWFASQQLDRTRFPQVPAQVAECQRLCKSSGSSSDGRGSANASGGGCAGWTLIKVTATSGQPAPLCFLFNATAIGGANGGYQPDGNCECGSLAALSPGPPLPSELSVDAVRIVWDDNDLQTGAETVFVPATGAALTYSPANASLVHFNWTLPSRIANGALSLLGTIAARPAAQAGWGASATGTSWWAESRPAAETGTTAPAPPALLELLDWTLDRVAISPANGRLPAYIELGFALFSLNQTGDAAYYTQSAKTWCAPGSGCQEWSTAPVSATIPFAPTTATAAPGASTAPAPRRPNPPSPLTWQPPVIPPAEAALLARGRSDLLGGARPSAGLGLSLFATATTLPFQVRAGPTGSGAFGGGLARIATGLRCSPLLRPAAVFRASLGVYSDLNEDGRVDDVDANIFNRECVPPAPAFVRSALAVKIGNDYTSYSQQSHSPRISFNATLDILQGFAHMTAGFPLVAYLVGWQGTGHDTLYPSLDVLNAELGSATDLARLVEQAAAGCNATISYHINTDEAYWNYTLPGPLHNTHNPDTSPAMLAKTPSGAIWPWSSGAGRTDPEQGPAFHISKTLDFVSGRRWPRLQRFLEVLPALPPVFHCDAYRDINVSFEPDGFIAEDSEMLCGCQTDAAFFSARANATFGVEGSNGCLSNLLGTVTYFWHGSDSVRSWGRIVMGTSMGLDSDVTPTSSTNPLLHYDAVLGILYTRALPYLLQLTDPYAYDSSRWRCGGNATHWPAYGSMVEYRRPDGVFFLPRVRAPSSSIKSGRGYDGMMGSNRDGGASASRNSNVCDGVAAMLDPRQAYVFASLLGGRKTFALPADWQRLRNLRIAAETITPSGRAPGPEVLISSGGPAPSFTLVGVPARQPILLSVEGESLHS